MSDTGTQQDVFRRNRAPCVNCKNSKRKCDRARSRCSRCRNQNLTCIPSTNALWRIEGVDSASQRIRAQRSSKKKQNPHGRVIEEPDETSAFQIGSPSQSTVQFTPPDFVPVGDLDLFLANDEGSSFPDIDGITFEDFQSAQNAFISPDQFGDLLSYRSASSHTPEAELQARSMPLHLNEPTLNPRLPFTHPATSYLWQEFIQSIAPGICIEDHEHNNQVTKYFASNAASWPSLFSAIIFLSYSVKSNWTIQHPLFVNMTEVTTAAVRMEQQAVSYIGDVMSRESGQSTSNETQSSPNNPTHRLTTLSTLIALCSAYIAGENISSLRTCLGHAMRIAREGFTTDLAADESFLFLVRWLGYIHIVALLDETDYSIDAPNYFGIAAKPDHVSPNREQFFQDVDPFIGISHSVGDLLYRLGGVLRDRRNASMTGHLSESWRSDTDSVDVETRMQLLLRRLKNHRKNEKKPPSHLDSYNEALVYSGLLLFLLFSKEEPFNLGLVQSTINHILDSCAAVPADAPVAKLMLLPLFTAGSRTTRPLHHDFIRRRLEVLKSGQCIVNVTRTMELLEERWREQKKSDDSQLMYSFLSMRHSLTPDLELQEASVCVLF
ncbi:unnamed protein product [Penicillium crustosum]